MTRLLTARVENATVGGMEIQGVDVEIVGHGQSMFARPKSIRINGVETALPMGARITIDGELGKGPVTVTMTMIARSVSIRPLEVGPAT
jgi:hypothetical protein